MRRTLLICLLLLLQGCAFHLDAKDIPGRNTALQPKEDVPPSFLKDRIIPIQSTFSFTEVAGWLTNDIVLFSEEEDGNTIVYTYDIHSGKKDTFFETEGWVLQMDWNEHMNLLALKIINERDEAKVVIIDEEGNERMNIEGFGEDYNIFWNPYVEDEFMMVAFLPNWEFDTFLVSVHEEKVTPVPVNETYMQWVSKSNVAYIGWSELDGPAYEAPLYEFDVKTKEQSKWLDSVISFIGFPNELTLTITVESMYDLYSTYTFYKGKKPYRTIEVPILNTYSDQWWIPFHTYDKENDIFYYLRPKYSGDYLSYEDGYELIAYDVHKDAEEKLTTLMHHEPLLHSPNGKFLLIGNRFEQIFHIEKKEMYPLWSN